MKIKFKYLMAAAAAVLTLGFVSCSKDDTGGTPAPGAGDPTSFTIAIGQPTTYAADDDNASTNELNFSTVDVFIYDAASFVQVNHHYLTLADFGAPSNNVYTSTKKLSTTTGAKLVYVGVNLPTAIADKIKAAQSTAGLSAVHDITTQQLTQAGGFAMFSASAANPSFVADENDPANKVTVSVARLVAKVTVENKLTMPYGVAGGNIAGLEFTLGNLNTKMFPFQQNNTGVIVDPNWTDATTAPQLPTYIGDFADPAPMTGYITVDQYVASTPGKNLKAKYAAENSSERHLKGETTYISIKGVFTPGNFDDTGVPSGPVSFWTVKTTGGTKYFEQEANADTYHAANPGSIRSEEYVDGVCYYTMYLNPSNGFNTLRNDFYRTSIKDILGLGNPTPGPKDPENPVDEQTNILIEVDILPWNVVSDEYELMP